MLIDTAPPLSVMLWTKKAEFLTGLRRVWTWVLDHQSDVVAEVLVVT